MPGIEIKGRSKRANYRHGGRTRKFGGGRTNLLEQLGRVEAEPSNPNRRAEISRVHGELNRGYKDGGRIGFRTGKGVVPRRSQPPHKETMIPSRLDSQRKNIRLRAERKKGKYRDPNTAEPEWSLNKWGLKEGGRAGKLAGGVTRRAAKTFIERAGGSAEGKPHSTKEGRIASGKRKITRFLGRHADKYKNPKRKFPPDKPTWSDMPRKPLEKSKMQPLKKGGRAGFVHGSVAKTAKKGIGKLRKPPGVFKPKDFKGKGSDKGGKAKG